MPMIPSILGERSRRCNCVPFALAPPWLVAAAILAILLMPRGLRAQAGDAVYGKEMLEVRRCTSCHPVDGAGKGNAPDLGRPSPQDVSPAAVAASLWNHGPLMWKQMSEQGIPIPSLSWVDGANFYAYLYPVRYFDPPGDPGRGEQVFNSKSCANCHALTPNGEAGATLSPAPPVSAWLTIADPVMWMQQMWNHSAGMAEQARQTTDSWPEFTLQEMADLLAYLENLPELGFVNPGLALGDSSAGRYSFEEKCSQCHSLGEEEGKVDLTPAARQQPRLSGLAVKMWNHRPLMAKAAKQKDMELPVFEDNEMSDLLAYLFESGYFQVRGNAEQGEMVYEAKGCLSCHATGKAGAQPIRGTGAPFTASRLVFSIWRHGPDMQAQMNSHEKEWPTLTEQEVADLIAYLDGR